MYYALNENVYLVKGACKSCIYDFNTSKLYSVNNALSEKLDLVNQGGLGVSNESDDIQNVFNELQKVGVLTTVEAPVSRDISELKFQDAGCIFAWIEITTKCNLRCLHCYNESDAHCDTIMSFNEYKKVIDGLIDLGVSKVQLIGGEPFTHKNLLEMLEYTVGKFQAIEIFTNGTLITNHWLEYLAKNNIRMALSVYSYNSKNHDQITGGEGSWEKTVNTINLLKKHGIEYRVCNVLMRGVEIGEKTTDLFELSEEKDVVRMSGRANFSLLTDDLLMKKLITKKTFQTPIRRNFCGNLVSGHNCFRNKIYVSADLMVYPCVMERRLTHCRVGDNGEIKLDATLRFLNKDNIQECCQCEYRYACFDCRPNSLSGDTLEKPWYCTYSPLTGEWDDPEVFVRQLKQKWQGDLAFD